MPSRNTAWMGMPPATLASMATLTPAWMARSQRSGPHSAINSLFAVITDLWLSIAVSRICRAMVVPPTSSTTMSTSGLVATWRQSSVRVTSPSASGSTRVSASRLDTIFRRNRKPSFCAI